MRKRTRDPKTYVTGEPKGPRTYDTLGPKVSKQVVPTVDSERMLQLLRTFVPEGGLMTRTIEVGLTDPDDDTTRNFLKNYRALFEPIVGASLSLAPPYITGAEGIAIKNVRTHPASITMTMTPAAHKDLVEKWKERAAAKPTPPPPSL